MSFYTKLGNLSRDISVPPGYVVASPGGYSSTHHYPDNDMYGDVGPLNGYPHSGQWGNMYTQGRSEDTNIPPYIQGDPRNEDEPTRTFDLIDTKTVREDIAALAKASKESEKKAKENFTYLDVTPIEPHTPFRKAVAKAIAGSLFVAGALLLFKTAKKVVKDRLPSDYREYEYGLLSLIFIILGALVTKFFV